MPEAIVDTNVLLRHLLQDNPGQAQAATHLLERIESGEIDAALSVIAIAEAVWVLQGRQYGLQRDDIRAGLSQITQIANLRVPERDTILQALELYAAHRVDFADGYFAALTRSRGGAVYSFDRDFDRIPGVTRIEPSISTS